MKKYFDIIKTNLLFAGIDITEFESILACVQGRVQQYPRGAVILLAGSPVETVGLVLAGRAQVTRTDSNGKPSLLTELHAGELFGEVFACVGTQHSPVTVIAVDPSEVLHLNYRRVITTCASSCSFHHRLVENMLTLIAHKNLMLSQKLELLSRRTTRERLLLYFEQCSGNASQFTLPLSREALSAYLCVDRSAMSAELSRMQRDGLISYKGNWVELKC